MHPRVSVSAICTFDWTMDQDLEFWASAGITNVGVSVAKLERAGWDDAVARTAAAGLRVTNLIGLGPFRLDDPEQWTAQRARLDRAVAAAVALEAECLVFTTGPAARLDWDEAAGALTEALDPVLRDAHALDAEPARARRRRHPPRADSRHSARSRLRGLLRPRAHRAGHQRRGLRLRGPPWPRLARRDAHAFRRLSPKSSPGRAFTGPRSTVRRTLAEAVRNPWPRTARRNGVRFKSSGGRCRYTKFAMRRSSR